MAPHFYEIWFSVKTDGQTKQVGYEVEIDDECIFQTVIKLTTTQLTKECVPERIKILNFFVALIHESETLVERFGEDLRLAPKFAIVGKKGKKHTENDWRIQVGIKTDQSPTVGGLITFNFTLIHSNGVLERLFNDFFDNDNYMKILNDCFSKIDMFQAQ